MDCCPVDSFSLAQKRKQLERYRAIKLRYVIAAALVFSTLITSVPVLVQHRFMMSTFLESWIENSLRLLPLALAKPAAEALIRRQLDEHDKRARSSETKQ